MEPSSQPEVRPPQASLSNNPQTQAVRELGPSSSSSSSYPSHHTALAPTDERRPSDLRPGASRLGPVNGLHPSYRPHRLQSTDALESRSPGTPLLREGSQLRRYDSHSLLSENSIALSRFDLSEGAPFPE